MNRRIQVLLVYLGTLPLLWAEPDPGVGREAKFAALLTGHVRDGLVDYRALAQNRVQLNQCLEAYAGVTDWEFNGWTVPERLAHLGNLYNLCVLKIVADDYPLRRIQQAGGWFSGDPFQWNVAPLMGHRISLEILFRNYIRRDYAEPLMLFALSPAARGGPPLRSEPYSADRLYAQLDDQAKRFLSTAPYNRIDKDRRRVHLSQLFRKYGGDFERKYGSVKAFLNATAPADWGRVDRYAIYYTDFDWRLNDLATASK